MIKINLGKNRKDNQKFDLKNIDLNALIGALKGIGKKQSAAASASTSSSPGDGFRNNGLIKLILVCLTLYFANDTLEGFKKEEIDKIDRQISKVEQETNQYQQKLAQMKGYESIKQQLETDEKALRTKLEVLAKLMEGRQAPPKMLLQLSQIIPQDVWLNNLRVGDVDVQITGQAPSYEPVSEFIKAISTSSYMSDVVLKEVVENKSPNQDQKLQNFILAAKRRQVF